MLHLPIIGQEWHPIFNKVDSIYQINLPIIKQREQLIRQYTDLKTEENQIQHIQDSINEKMLKLQQDKQHLDIQMKQLNIAMDSLLPPPPPPGPMPKENLFDKLKKKGWSFNGNFGLSLNELTLANWAAGGESSTAGRIFANYNLTIAKEKVTYQMQGNFAYGIARYTDKRVEKSDDKIDLQFSISKKNSNLFKFSTMSTFNSQFAPGYSYPNDSVLISSFFAPAYLTLSGGYTLSDKKNIIQVYLSPVAGKVTFVLDQGLADKGAFGVKAGYYDNDSIWIPGEKTLGALGANLIINYSQKIRNIISLASVFNCYYNYSEKRDDNRIKIDLNWEGSVNFLINKRVTTILFVHLKYDHNTTFPVSDIINGEEVVVDNVPKLQFKESLGIAFTYTI